MGCGWLVMTDGRSTGRRPAGCGWHPPEFASVSALGGVARAFRVTPQVGLQVSEFFTRFGEYFGLGPTDEMVPAREHVGSRVVHTRFAQRYRGVPVSGGEAVIAHDGGHVVSG